MTSDKAPLEIKPKIKQHIDVKIDENKKLTARWKNFTKTLQFYYKVRHVNLAKEAWMEKGKFSNETSVYFYQPNFDHFIISKPRLSIA